jgi:hypothetical protein
VRSWVLVPSLEPWVYWRKIYSSLGRYDRANGVGWEEMDYEANGSCPSQTV